MLCNQKKAIWECVYFFAVTPLLLFCYTVPSGYPQNVEATAVSSRMSTLSWDPPDYEDRNGIIIGYVINVTNTRRSETLQYTSNTTALTLSTLSPYTTYYCILAAQTSVGTGPFSAVITLRTPPDGKKTCLPPQLLEYFIHRNNLLFYSVPSSPPQSLHGNAMSSTGISLFWDPPPADAQNGIITRYMISITDVETGRSFSLFSATTSVNVTSLHPYYTYNFTIAAVTIVGDGPYTTSITIVTLQDGKFLCYIIILTATVTNRTLIVCKNQKVFAFHFTSLCSSEWSSTNHYSPSQQCNKPLHYLESSSSSRTKWNHYWLHCEYYWCRDWRATTTYISVTISKCDRIDTIYYLPLYCRCIYCNRTWTIQYSDYHPNTRSRYQMNSIVIQHCYAWL